jgi:hypothetical protein
MLDRAHQVNPSARRIILVAGFQIGGAGGKAQSAVDAGERFLVVEEMSRSG